MSRNARRSAFAAIALPLLVAGCLGGAALPPDAPDLRLDAVPFHPQERWQCGPAALATVLGASGLEVTPAALVPQVWVPGRRGTLAPELLGTTRRLGRIAYRTEGTIAALIAELEAGRPVLVFQNLGIAAIPRWHYAVVVGVDPAAGELLLRSGTERLGRTPVALFERTWARSDRWAMVALRGDERPAVVDRRRWLGAIAAVEAAGDAALARRAFDAWLVDHADDAVARFGRAATAARLGDLDAAAADYERLLEQGGEDVRVLNNLAEVRARQGCPATARALLDRALARATADERRVVESTRAAIADGAPDDRCPLGSR
jgi:hypothetical protein